MQDYYRDENSWSVVNGFQEPNKDAYLPRAAYSAKNEQVQTKYLQDASYIRLKNLQIGYTLPQDLTRKISIEKLRVYFSGENLWTGTSLSATRDARCGISIPTGGSIWGMCRAQNVPTMMIQAGR